MHMDPGSRRVIHEIIPVWLRITGSLSVRLSAVIICGDSEVTGGWPRSRGHQNDMILFFN